MSDLNTTHKKTSIGGQALLEGLLMIGPNESAIAVRKPDGGIIVEKKPLPAKGKIFKVPVIRGMVSFVRQMVLGVKALMFSAEFIEVEEEEKKTREPGRFRIFLNRTVGVRFKKLALKADALAEKIMAGKMMDIAVYFTVLVSTLFSVGLFILLPNLLASIMPFNKHTWSGGVYYNLFEGVVRVGLFICYLALVSKLNEMKRIWQYHGAEHKTIHCYEANEELTVENVMRFSTRHPRCGTSFLFIVMVVSIIVFSFLPLYNSAVMNALLRLALVPFVAGIAYEIIKFAGRSEMKLFKIISMPGLMFQLFTTMEPDESQVEVAITAFKNVLVPDTEADKW